MKKKVFLAVLFFCLTVVSGTVYGGTNPEAANTYVVIFKDEQLPADYKSEITGRGGRIVSANEAIGTVLIEAQDAGFIEKIKRNAKVEDSGLAGYVKPDMLNWIEVNKESLSVAESYYDQYQWDIKRVGGNPETWAIEDGDHSVVIGVIDTGVDKTHPDIMDNYLYGKSLLAEFPDAGEDLIGHGTFVAGEIAGNGMIKGVAPGLGIASYRVFGLEALTSISVVSQAIVTAANDGVDILNLSLGSLVDLADPSMRAQYKEFLRAVLYAERKGVIIVTSSGNEALNLDKTGRIRSLPGEFPGVITVSATTNTDKLAFYSNYGASIIDYCAPGGDMGPNYIPDDLSTVDWSYACFGIVPGGYAYTVGTSMAAPKVTGVLGLIKSHFPKLINARLLIKLRNATENIGKRVYFGNGLINAQLAFD